MRKRAAFWKDSLIAGLPHIGKLAALATLVVGGSVTVALGFVLHLGADWTAFVVLALVLAVYAEGSYRLWDVTAEARDAALRELEQESSREALIARVEGYMRELQLLQAEAPDKTGAVGPPYDWREYMVDYNDLGTRVARDLRLHAAGFLDYWKRVPPGVDPASHPPPDIGLPLFTEHSLHLLAHIAAQLRSGMDRP